MAGLLGEGLLQPLPQQHGRVSVQGFRPASKADAHVSDQIVQKAPLSLTWEFCWVPFKPANTS